MNLKKVGLIVFVSIMSMVACEPNGMACESLDTLSLGQQIPATSATGFQLPTMDIGVLPLELDSGANVTAGFARIENGVHAGGDANEINVSNAMLGLGIGSFGEPALQRLRLSFGEYGGILNLSINDELVVFDDFSDIDGALIGGVRVNLITGGSGNDMGQIEFIGDIREQGGVASGIGKLGVGGQELYVDDICFSPGS